MSNALITNEGTVTLKLLTSSHETTHSFHIMGDNLTANMMEFRPRLLDKQEAQY